MNTDSKKNRKVRKAIIPVLIGIAAGLLIILTVLFAYGRTSFPKDAQKYIGEMFRSFDERSENIRDMEQYGMATNELLIRNVASAYVGVDLSENNGYEVYQQAAELRNLIADSDIRAIHIVDENGKILLTTDSMELVTGDSIITSGVLTEEQFDGLRQTAEEMDWKAIVRASSNSDEYDYQEPLVVEDSMERKEFYTALTSGRVTDIYAPVVNEYVIMECSGRVEGSYRSVLSDLSAYFSVDSSGGSFTQFMVDTDTGIIVYGSDDFDPMIGSTAASHGIDLNAVLREDGVKELTIDGKKAYVYSAQYHSDELGNLVLICRYHMIMEGAAAPILAVMGIIAVIVIIITVSGLTMESSEKKAVNRKMAGLAVLAEVIIAVAAMYFVSVSAISRYMNASPRIVDAFIESTLKNAEAGEEVNNFYQKRVVSIARSTRSYMERLEGFAIGATGEESMTYLAIDDTGKAEPVPDVYGNPTVSIPRSGLMGALCYMGAFDTVYILDANGRTIVTSGDEWYYDIVSGRHQTDEEVMKVLQRQSPSYYYLEEDEDSSDKGTTIAVPIDLYVSNDTENKATVYHNRGDYENDGTGTIEKKYGVLLIKNRLSNTLTVGFRASAYASLSAIESAGNQHVSLVSAEVPHKGLDYHALTEAEVSALGFTDEEYMHDSYRFTFGIYGDTFASLMKLGDIDETADRKDSRAIRMLILSPKEDVFRDRLFTVTLFLGVSILLCVLSCAVVAHEKKKELQGPAAETPEQRMERTIGERTAEKEAGVVIGRNTGIAAKLIKACLYGAGLILLVFAFRTGAGREGNFFSYMLMKQWPKDLNIFSVSYVMFLCVVITAILTAARNLVELISSSLTAVAETVVRLVLSIIQYAGIMMLAFYSMQMLGVQTGTVITFGGIITGVIGLGANSLISDIIAGLFIIFEREFRVNDIVTIDGFTGVVRGISLRTTRVQDAVGNVKTFNNSKIGAVLNLTENYSTAFATVNVGLEVPVEKVETLVNKELPGRMAENGDIVEGPWFSGIMEIKGGFYTISVAARCEQQKQWTVKKELAKHVLELLKENNIRIA